jgi:murein L,D-transpeptidase YcbB/YkuD
MLRPGEVDSHNKREPVAADPLALLTVFPLEEPVGFLRGLAPASPEYARLLRERMRLEALIAAGGWGPAAPEGRLEPGAAGGAVVALRDRLVAMGHLAPTATALYDDRVRAAVERAQGAHGLLVDGVAGEGTLAELNMSPEERLRSVLVALERERWTAAPRGARHVWVNLADFTAAVVDDDVVTFRTRAVIGAESEDRQSPEFSDLMEYMVINPSWHVPRSIIVNEYLPALRRNRNAAGHLRIVNSSGQVVSRGSVRTGGSFPYSMVQPPGPGNALGVVKFMFPNPWNIYLHDTPSKDLFAQETRAFSHGCIRLADPRASPITSSRGRSQTHGRVRAPPDPRRREPGGPLGAGPRAPRLPHGLHGRGGRPAVPARRLRPRRTHLGRAGSGGRGERRPQG